MAHSHSHNHDHGHDHHSGAHDHSDDLEPALQKHIYQQIEFDKIITLNETEPGSGAKIVRKTWAERLEGEPMLASDADEQLLMTIPFAGTVRLHSILVRSSETESAPKTLKVFLNRNDLDFAAATDLEPTQTLILSQTSEVQDVQVKRPLFGNTYSLTLLFEDGFGADSTEVFYLGFKGEFMMLNREPVEVLYEKAANPRDHTPIVGVSSMAAQGPGRGM